MANKIQSFKFMKMNNKTNQYRSAYFQNNKEKGATLIEAMVSLFVFAVGALGIAAMQTTTLVRADDTKQRSIAIWKAQELADRMRVTITPRRPDGLIKEYVTEVGNSNKDSIGKVNESDVYSCPSTAPTRCDDVDDSTKAASCTQAQLIKFDVWSVMCDPDSGISGGSNDGSIGLRDVELAVTRNDADGTVRIYFEWANRDSSNDEKLQSSKKEIATDLCGVEEPVDARLDAYCLRVL